MLGEEFTLRERAKREDLEKYADEAYEAFKEGGEEELIEYIMNLIDHYAFTKRNLEILTDMIKIRQGKENLH